MPNGQQCCALEICCDPPAAREKSIASIAAFAKCEPEYAAKFLDWMDHEGLIFAPPSMRAVMDDVAKMARHVK
jgi:hypothetical protein